MTTLSLVSGPPGSGKSEFFLGHAAERYQADPFADTLVLVPTLRHGDQFRRRLVAQCGVAFGMRIQAIAQLSHELTDGTAVADMRLANELLHRVAAAAIDRGGASYFAPIARSEGLRRLLTVAVSELLAEDVDTERLTSAAGQAGQPGLIALAAVYSDYVHELAVRGWVHPSQLPAAAARALGTSSAVPPLVLIDGFQLFRGVELRLIEGIVARADVMISLDPDAGERARHTRRELLRRFPDAELIELASVAAPALAITTGEAADREAEFRAMAREVKQRLTDAPTLRPSDFAITVRQVTPYLSLARQVFAEYDLPLDPAAGEPLATRPLGIWLRRLLGLARDGWRLRDLMAVLSSGFMERARWDLDRGAVARIARYGRERHLWAGRDALTRIVEALRTDAAAPATPDAIREVLGRTADGLAAALGELGSLLESGEASTAEHARLLDAALFGQGALVRADARELSGVEIEIEALRGYLLGLAAVDGALGPARITFAEFVARLEEELEAPAVVLREAGGVLLAPMHTLHGLRFAHVSIGGLVEGEFPAARTATALLDGAARQVLRDGGLDLPPEPRAAEDELWDSARSRADQSLSLWRSRLDERGRPAAQSFYFDSLPATTSVDVRAAEPEAAASRRELAIASTRQWLTGGRVRPAGVLAWPVVRQAVAVEQRRRSFGHGGAFEGRIGADLVPQLTGPDAVWSASRLESYRTCAFQFFGQYALRLRELDEEQDSADAATRGTVIHAVLQDALAPIVTSGRALTSQTLDEALARMQSHGAPIWNRAPDEYGFGRAALWRLDAEGVFEQLAELLAREAWASEVLGVTSVRGAEVRLDAALALDPPLRVTATVDRLDLGPDVAVVVDYKSGREIPRSHIVEGRRVQLQLYGSLARAAAGTSRVVARYAWMNLRSAEWDLDTARPEDAAMLDDVVRIAGEVRTAVSAGDFRVNPQVATCPSYCAFIHVCRVNELSRWKRWD